MKSIRFFTFMFLGWIAVIVFTPLVIIASLFGNRSAFTMVRGWAHLIFFFMKNICGLTYRLEGAENIPADACVVLMKHASVYETLVQLVLFPMQCWVLKRELMWLPFFGWTVATLKPIAINRGKGGAAVKQVIKQGIKRLAAGITIVIFPEGTRMPVGETKRYGLSGTLLAQEAKVKILPIAHNAGYHWPRQRNYIEPGEVTFVIGNLVDPVGREPREVNTEIQNWIEGEVNRLADS